MSTKRARPARRPTVHIRAGDTVYVRAGRDRESRLTAEEIERLDPEAQRSEVNRRPGRRAHTRVIVEGVNMLTKHTRPRGRASKTTQLQTGRIEQPGPISIANIMLVCPRCDRPTRVRKGTFEGKTARLCRRCGEPVDAIR